MPFPAGSDRGMGVARVWVTWDTWASQGAGLWGRVHLASFVFPTSWLIKLGSLLGRDGGCSDGWGVGFWTPSLLFGPIQKLNLRSEKRLGLQHKRPW